MVNHSAFSGLFSNVQVICPITENIIQTKMVLNQGKVIFHCNDQEAFDLAKNQLGNQSDKMFDNEYWIVPPFIDFGFRLTEPGYKQRGLFETEARLALNAGINHLVTWPETNPVNDSSAVTRLILNLNEHYPQLSLSRLSQ